MIITLFLLVGFIELVTLPNNLLFPVPTKPPVTFSLNASSSTSITASWQLPPENNRHGIIAGFKLFYKKTGSAGSAVMLPINNGTSRTKDVTGLNKYTEYEFQILAFTSVGDGPNSSVAMRKTKEDGENLDCLKK